MRDRIASMNARTEFWLVVILCFGYFVVVSAVYLLVGHISTITDRGAFSLAAFELIALAAVWQIGVIRGWSFGSFGLRVSWRLVFGGVITYAGVIIGLRLFYILLWSLAFDLNRLRVPVKAGALTLAGVIVVSLINPVFEETMVVGYIFRATEKRGAGFSIGASTLLRFLYHTYQGPAAAVVIAPIGIVFARPDGFLRPASARGCVSPGELFA